MAVRTLQTFGASFVGDGTSKTISFDLTKPPFNLNLNGNSPVAVDLSGSPVGVTGTLHGTNLTLAFDDPVPTGGVGFNIGLYFE